MSNILDGIQYRELTPEFGTYGAERTYEEWKDTAGRVAFTTRTQFRLKPSISYSASCGENVVPITGTKEYVMTSVSEQIDHGSTWTVKRIEVPASVSFNTFAQQRRLQFRAMSSTQTWKDVYSTIQAGLGHPVEFRLRPDEQYVVRFTGANNQSVVRFDDVGKLNEYTSRMTTTGSFGFTVTMEPHV